VSWYQPKHFLVEAEQLTLFNTDKIERMVGGDGGRCPNDHAGCLVFATKQGARHVLLGQYVIVVAGKYVQIEDKHVFELRYEVAYDDT
jgi:phage terminase large subunit-like protein